MSFSLTRKTDYALVALVRLAAEKDRDGGPLSARQLANEHGLPLHLLMNALKELHRAGILCSRRGVSGGYYLCKDPTQTSLRQVIEALEGPVCVTLCNDENDHASTTCQLVETCPISEPIRGFNGLLNGFLSSIKLRDLMIAEHARNGQKVGVSV